MTGRLVAALAAALLLGCVTHTHRGNVSVISAHGVPPKYAILATTVEGSACDLFGTSPLLERAIDDALARVPQADVLASADVSIRRGLFGIWRCYDVEGAALLVTP